jgi:serine/threonine protein kinase
MANSETERTDKFERIGVQSVTAVALASDFRPIRALSRGGMGAILLAEEVVTKRLVAIKVLNPETKSLLPLAQQFMREAVITARLQHPNVVPVYRLGFLDGDRQHPHLFFTMKFIDGSSYATVRHKLSLDERLAVLGGVAAALTYAHSRKLWHRDLKPDNVMLGPYDDVYVVDWGLVSIAPGAGYRLDLPEIAMLDLVQALPDEIDTLLEETAEAVTVAGAGGPNKVLGTPLYMSPEQASDDRDLMGPPSDVWALGVMLFEALCDMHPYVDDLSASNLEILTSTLTTKIPPVFRVAPQVPSQIAALCDAMLAHDIAARPQASDVLHVLRALVRGRVAGAPGRSAQGAQGAHDGPTHISNTLLQSTSKTIVGQQRSRSLALAPLPARPSSSLTTPPGGGVVLAEPLPELSPDAVYPPYANEAANANDATGALYVNYAGDVEAAAQPAQLTRVSDEADVPPGKPATPLSRGARREPVPPSQQPPPASRTVTIVSPDGYRVEGITAEQALSFLKTLGR